MKERLTITMDKNAISLIDSAIGRNNIQNRSQAIESIVNAHFSSANKMKAVILAGKKPSQESIKETLSLLERAGVGELIIAGGKNNEGIFSMINTDRRFSEKSTFLRETTSMGTAGIIKSAEQSFRSTFFAVYSDITYKIDFAEMLNAHKNSGNLATIALTMPEKKSDLIDEVRVSGNKVTEFKYNSKKPTKLQNAGIFVFETGALDFFPTKGSLEDDVLPKLAKMGKLGNFLFDTAWKHEG